MHKGYLSLPADWLSKNRNFKLSIPIAPRLIASHPFTNQNTFSVARGPVVYCAEDYDNDWVKDHFKVRDNLSFSVNSLCRPLTHPF